MAPILFDLHVLYRHQARISNFEHVDDGMQPYSKCEVDHRLCGVMRSNQRQSRYASYTSNR